MKHKKSFKAMWNVFLFVICGGSLIFGFVQQRRAAESQLQSEKFEQRIDSLKSEIKKIQEENKNP